MLGENRPMHLPGAHLEVNILNDRDETDIREFGIKYGVDMIAISLVRSAENIETVRSMLNNNGGERIKVYAKIENYEGL